MDRRKDESGDGHPDETVAGGVGPSEGTDGSGGPIDQAAGGAGDGVGTSEVEWEYRDHFKIHGQMKQVIELTIEATEKQLSSLRRKLDKLTYGG